MGTHPSEPALTLIGISPSRGSHPNALFSYGGLVTTRLETGRKYHYCFCLSLPSIRVAPYRLNLEQMSVHVACRFLRQQKECKRCVVYSVVRGRILSPHYGLPKNQKGCTPQIINFKKNFHPLTLDWAKNRAVERNYFSKFSNNFSANRKHSSIKSICKVLSLRRCFLLKCLYRVRDEQLYVALFYNNF